MVGPTVANCCLMLAQNKDCPLYRAFGHRTICLQRTDSSSTVNCSDIPYHFQNVSTNYQRWANNLCYLGNMYETFCKLCTYSHQQYKTYCKAICINLFIFEIFLLYGHVLTIPYVLVIIDNKLCIKVNFKYLKISIHCMDAIV